MPSVTYTVNSSNVSFLSGFNQTSYSHKRAIVRLLHETLRNTGTGWTSAGSQTVNVPTGISSSSPCIFWGTTNSLGITLCSFIDYPSGGGYYSNWGISYPSHLNTNGNFFPPFGSNIGDLRFNVVGTHMPYIDSVGDSDGGSKTYRIFYDDKSVIVIDITNTITTNHSGSYAFDYGNYHRIFYFLSWNTTINSTNYTFAVVGNDITDNIDYFVYNMVNFVVLVKDNTNNLIAYYYNEDRTKYGKTSRNTVPRSLFNTGNVVGIAPSGSASFLATTYPPKIRVGNNFYEIPPYILFFTSFQDLANGTTIDLDMLGTYEMYSLTVPNSYSTYYQTRHMIGVKVI